MRALFNEHYKKGRGFTTDDMIAIVNRITGKDYHQFYRDFVFGTAVPDYDRIFGYAGMKLVKKNEAFPDFGFSLRPRNGGLTVTGIDTNGAATVAGLRVGDVVTKINGTPVFEAQTDSMAGKEIKLTITRDGAEMELPMKVGSRSFTSFSLADSPAATPRQVMIREGWLKR